MVNLKKSLLEKIAVSWREHFPFMHQVNLQETPKIPKNCNYRCDSYSLSRGLFYFFQISFPPKREGEFTLVIVISNDANKSVIDHGIALNPTKNAIGRYGIWQFMGRQRYSWSLKDIDIENERFFKAAGIENVQFSKTDSDKKWKPKSYNMPVDEIIDSAIQDVNACLIRHVIPQLDLI